MILCRAITAIVVAVLLVGKAQADEKEPAAILEIGAATERSLQEGNSSFGPSVATEVTPIKNWLEIEIGFAPLFRRGQTELGTDLLFKKPFELSDKVEFMVGVGPEWKHTIGGGKATDSVAGEVAL